MAIRKAQGQSRSRCTGHIRWLIRRDMPEVLEIERESFAQPWDDDDYVRCLRQPNVIGKVLEEDEEVVGYMLYELHKTSLRILRLAVDPWHRRRAVARQLIESLIHKLAPARRTVLAINVRESNLVAQLFLRRLGFTAVAIDQRFYSDTDEDAYCFEFWCAETEP